MEEDDWWKHVDKAGNPQHYQRGNVRTMIFHTPSPMRISYMKRGNHQIFNFGFFKASVISQSRNRSLIGEDTTAGLCLGIQTLPS